MARHEDLQSVAAYADDACGSPLAGAARGVGIDRPQRHGRAPARTASADGVDASRWRADSRGRTAADGPPQQRLALVRPVHRAGVAGAVRPTSAGPTPISLFAEQRVA